ncbi:PREDICTED: glycolipid transfer protein 2 isoform X1 [Tarenaya hassleriana]|uniref:glycolipid transfer protein 2 isoform X1 n=1 Tax=Tarenaya hassleriana TaxID=28532 RepID=UPI00053C66BE|nr:PREDICTED: glycolipid transfer protein 2 isoform X1 [Tarenaya hassleriana]
MKRKRCEMMEKKKKKKTEIRSAIEELSVLIITKSPDDSEAINIPLKPLLSFCNLIIQVLDKIGPTMAVLRQDIDQNIQKLEKLCESNPHCVHANLVEILKKEGEEGVSKMSNSCSRAVLWLTRTMDFTTALLQRLSEDVSRNIEEAVEECYIATLKPWHGWISSAAFKVALRLVPDNKTLMSAIAEDESLEELKEDMETLVSLLEPILRDIHSVLERYELNRIRST